MKSTLPELDLAIIFGDGRRLIEEALRKIPDNYPISPNLLSAFYRETVQKGRRYISVAEAIMNVYKTSFTRAEFSLDLNDIDKATSAILYKKPTGLHFLPQEVSFLVTYRNEGGVTRLNYIRNEMRFKCDWKRLAFSSAYTVRSEMVVVEREDREEITIDRKDSFRSTEIFYDMVQEYWDKDFWSEYNIIEPTESLENAVKRLKRKQ